MDFKDPVIKRVCEKFVDRSNVGIKKYNVTLEDNNDDMFIWLNHLQEELMDAVLYLQKAKEMHQKDIKDIKDIKNN